MEKYLVRKSLHATLFVVVLIFMEMIMFKSLGMGAMPVYWLIDVSAITLLAVIFFLLPFAVQKILSIIFTSVHCIMCILNVILFASSGRVFDWSMVLLLSEVTEVTNMIVVPKLYTISLVSILLIFIVVTLTCFKVCGKYYKVFIKKATNLIFAGVIAFLIAIQAILPSKILRTYNEDAFFVSDSYDYTTFNSAYTSVDKFGLFGYYVTSLARIVFPSFAPSFAISPSVFAFENYTTELNGLLKDDNVIFIMAESFEDFAISKELTPVLYALKNGVDLTECGINNFYNVEEDELGYRSLSRKDYIYNGDSYVQNGVNLFNGLEENQCGLVFNHYKSNESTNMAEIRALSGNYIDYRYSLPNMLNEAGYKTNYIHGNYKVFYGRNKYITNSIGFQNTLYYDDLEGKIECSGELDCYLRDSDIINYCSSDNGTFNIIDKENKYFSFMMTITTHGAYIDSDLLNEYYDFFDDVASASEDEMLKLYNSITDEILKSQVRNMLSKAMDTEKAVALLVDQLYNLGSLDSTCLVFVADHNAYSGRVGNFKKMYYESVLSREWSGDADSYEVPCFFYSTKLNGDSIDSYDSKRQIENVSSAWDLLPTILSLVGVEYKQETYLGYAAFAKSINTNEYIENNISYSSTNNIFIGKDFTSYDGYTFLSEIDLSSDYIILARDWANDYRKKYYFVKNFIQQEDYQSFW